MGKNLHFIKNVRWKGLHFDDDQCSKEKDDLKSPLKKRDCLLLKSRLNHFFFKLIPFKKYYIALASKDFQRKCAEIIKKKKNNSDLIFKVS